MMRTNRVGLALIAPVLLLSLWVLATTVGGVAAFILPSPLAVVQELGRLLVSVGLWTDIGWTMLRTMLGFGVGVTLGIGLGLAMGMWRSVHDAMILPVDAFRSIPATALFPLFMLCLGIGLESAVVLIAFPCMWLAAINSMYGVRNANPVRTEMATVYRLTEGQKFLYVTFPDAISSVIASLRLSIAMCLHMAIIAEMFMGSEVGIGRRIFDAHMVLRVPEMYACIILVGFLGYAVNLLLVSAESRLSWERQDRK